MENKIKEILLSNSVAIFGTTIEESKIQFQKTRKDVEGDLTLVVFPFVKLMKVAPEVAAQKIGELLQSKINEIEKYSVVKGFLNISLTKHYWTEKLTVISQAVSYGRSTKKSGRTFMVEYASPNTNKPLHLGHLRNIFLGHSVAEILKANGHRVIKGQIVNDRGIHICKSMAAWKNYAPLNSDGKRETPASCQMKGDHFVGKYYVEFDKKVTEQGFELAEKWQKEEHNTTSISEEDKEQLKSLFSFFSQVTDEKKKKGIYRKIAKIATPYTSLMLEAKEMLSKWENNDPEVRTLWETMNDWVYDGFEKTYQRMGVDFDKTYFESNTYLLGKEIVQKGLDKGVFFKKEDSSVWIDLSDEGLDHKLVLRADGTAVYMTQDIGTAIERFKDYPDLESIIYTVGNEQDYHFQVLFIILKKLGYEWADLCQHLSYGMVDLPDGKMKSREGKVVDADDLMEEMVQLAKKSTKERGYIDEMSEKEKEQLYEMIGIGGIKYFILKVDPKKRMTFNPDESIELNGNTGAFIQYTYARIQSLLSKVQTDDKVSLLLEQPEIDLVKLLVNFPTIVKESGDNLSPAHLINYTYELVKSYNSFYQSRSILKEENQGLKAGRIQISKNTSKVIQTAMQMIGINVPKRM